MVPAKTAIHEAMRPAAALGSSVTSGAATAALAKLVSAGRVEPSVVSLLILLANSILLV